MNQCIISSIENRDNLRNFEKAVFPKRALAPFFGGSISCECETMITSDDCLSLQGARHSSAEVQMEERFPWGSTSIFWCDF
jgi:hypothetical protein